MWLIGMMGSGKTTVGREAARRARVDFYDTDRMVEEMSRMTINAIWDSVGETGFRDLERKAIATVPVSDVIVAAGGGAVLDAANREHMRRGRPVIWLRTSPDRLVARLEGGGERPLLLGEGSQEERLAAILEERWDLYSEVATDQVGTDDRELDEVIAEVMSIWGR